MRIGVETGASVVRRATWLVAFAFLCAAFAQSTCAATINYGNFGPVAPGVTFQQVTESSGTDPVPMFGPPTPFVTGLNFTPSNFVSSATGGSSDITDGQLNFTLAASPGQHIASVNLFEAGDYSLAGTGTTTTSVFVGAIIRATVIEINGVAVAPVNLTTTTSTYSDTLPGTVIVGPWSLNVAQNISSQLNPGQFATKVEISVDNQLISISESSSVAFIAKKEFQFNAVAAAVPEPGSVGLSVLLISAGLGARRRRRATATV
jgi:hypothetical protein